MDFFVMSNSAGKRFGHRPRFLETLYTVLVNSKWRITRYSSVLVVVSFGSNAILRFIFLLIHWIVTNMRMTSLFMKKFHSTNPSVNHPYFCIIHPICLIEHHYIAKLDSFASMRDQVFFRQYISIYSYNRRIDIRPHTATFKYPRNVFHDLMVRHKYIHQDTVGFTSDVGVGIYIRI